MLITLIAVLAVTFLLVRYIIGSFKISDHSSKYVFVTGCDSGFGRLLAVRLHELGFHVIATCYTQKGADDLKNDHRERMHTFLLDVSSSESIQSAYQQVQAILPAGTGLWALVNNAGVTGNTSAIEMASMKDFHDCNAINLYGPIEITKTFLPLVRKATGRVVQMGSQMGRFAGLQATYCVAKFGIRAFVDILRRELYPQGIKVVIIEPGTYKTGLMNFDSIKSYFEKSYNNASKEIQELYGEDYVEKKLKATKTVFANAYTDLNEVIDCYLHAITAKYPRDRYVVATDARFVFIPLTYMPDWFADAFLRAGERMLSK